MRSIAEQQIETTSLFWPSAYVPDWIHSRCFGGRKAAPDVHGRIAVLDPLAERCVAGGGQRAARNRLRVMPVDVRPDRGVPHGPAEVRLDSFVTGVDGDDERVERMLLSEPRVHGLFSEQARVRDRDALARVHSDHRPIWRASRGESSRAA